MLSPRSIQIIKEDIENVPFYGIRMDTGNFSMEKLFSVTIQYFSEPKVIQLKLVKFDSLENKTSKTYLMYCIYTLNYLNIPLNKLTKHSADYTNINFGERNRYGTNNVYFKLQSYYQNKSKELVFASNRKYVF